MNHFFAAWPHVSYHLWKLNVQAALLAAIVGIACIIGRRWLAPEWRSVLWMLVFVRMVIPFGPSSMLSLGNIISAFPGSSADVHPVETMRLKRETASVGPQVPVKGEQQRPAPDTAAAPARTEPKTVEAKPGWSARDACAAIWLLVAALLLGRLGWLRIQLSRYLSRLATIRQPELIRLAESATSEAKLSRAPRLLWGSPECGPAVCGWLFPVLILPRNSQIVQPSRLRAVLLHEFRHIRTADTLLAWLPRVLCATFWPNPLLWYASRKWQEERELSCDEWVLRQIGQDQKRSYLETLIAIAARSSGSPAIEFTANIFSSSATLERRIVAMKRYHPATQTGLIAGALMTLLAGAVGLTDAVRAGNEPIAERDPAPALTVSTAAGAPVDDKQASAQVAPQAETLKPKIVFAQHVILWEGTEILTHDQLKQRLAKLRAVQPVKPQVYHSLGFIWGKLGEAAEAEANDRANQAVGESLKLIGRDQWSFVGFLSRRGSGAVDRIRTEDSLKISPARSLKGRIVASKDIEGAAGKGTEGALVTMEPAAGAQVVILPLGEPCVVRLRDGKLREPVDEIWYKTNADGMFQADPASLSFDPVLLYGDGKYLSLILHESGYRVVNGQLAASDATYELLPWSEATIDARNLKEHEQVEIWMSPEGAHEKFPELSIGWISHSDRPVKMKLPRGTGRAAYWGKADDRWDDLEIRHPIHITADGPAEITLPAVP